MKQIRSDEDMAVLYAPPFQDSYTNEVESRISSVYYTPYTVCGCSLPLLFDKLSSDNSGWVGLY